MEIEERTVIRMCGFLLSITWTPCECMSLEIWCQCQWGSMSFDWNCSVKADERLSGNEGEFGAPAGEALAKMKSNAARRRRNRKYRRSVEIRRISFGNMPSKY